MSNKNILFDVDGLMEVLQAIKDGKPVEFRPLDEAQWQDFDPTDQEIDTENCKYRIKSCDYPDKPSNIQLSLEELQEDRIYALYRPTAYSFMGFCDGYICVKCNFWEGERYMSLHFSLKKCENGEILHLSTPDEPVFCSEKSVGFANVIGRNLVINDFKGLVITIPTKEQVEALQDKLRMVGYEFRDGKMQKIKTD